MSEPVLGLDLGGTVVKAGVVTPDGRVLSSVSRPSGERDGVGAWAEAALAAADAAVAAVPDTPPVAVGLAVPGAVDRAAVRLVDLVERLPSAGGVDLAATFAVLGLPVSADNDARAALAAERRWGGHPDPDDLVVLTIGTGVGGAVVIGGRVPAADAVLGGNQLGHLTVELDGRRCVCGNRGCVETVSSATALVAAAREAGLDVADAAEVFAADAAGDANVTPVIERFLAGLTAAVVNAIHAYQPAAVILGGGVMASAARILPPLREAVHERAWTSPRGRVRIVASALGHHAGVLAGAAVALT